MSWIKRFICRIFHHKRKEDSPELVTMQSNAIKDKKEEGTALVGTRLATAAKDVIRFIIDDSVWNTETFLAVEIHEAVDKMQTFFHEFGQSDIAKASFNQSESFKSLEMRVFNMEAKCVILKQECNVLNQEAEQLRSVIGNYTKVINEINAKRLKDKEFLQVKEKLEPQLQSIRKQREEYLIREGALNQKIQTFQQELNDAMIESKKFCKSILLSNKLEPFF